MNIILLVLLAHFNISAWDKAFSFPGGFSFGYHNWWQNQNSVIGKYTFEVIPNTGRGLSIYFKIISWVDTNGYKIAVLKGIDYKVYVNDVNVTERDIGLVKVKYINDNIDEFYRLYKADKLIKSNNLKLKKQEFLIKFKETK